MPPSLASVRPCCLRRLRNDGRPIRLHEIAMPLPTLPPLCADLQDRGGTGNASARLQVVCACVTSGDGHADVLPCLNALVCLGGGVTGRITLVMRAGYAGLTRGAGVWRVSEERVRHRRRFGAALVL